MQPILDILGNIIGYKNGSTDQFVSDQIEPSTFIYDINQKYKLKYGLSASGRTFVEYPGGGWNVIKTDMSAANIEAFRTASDNQAAMLKAYIEMSEINNIPQGVIWDVVNWNQLNINNIQKAALIKYGYEVPEIINVPLPPPVQNPPDDLPPIGNPGDEYIETLPVPLPIDPKSIEATTIMILDDARQALPMTAEPIYIEDYEEIKTTPLDLPVIDEPGVIFTDPGTIYDDPGTIYDDPGTINNPIPLDMPGEIIPIENNTPGVNIINAPNDQEKYFYLAGAALIAYLILKR